MYYWSRGLFTIDMIVILELRIIYNRCVLLDHWIIYHTYVLLDQWIIYNILRTIEIVDYLQYIGIYIILN